MSEIHVGMSIDFQGTRWLCQTINTYEKTTIASKSPSQYVEDMKSPNMTCLDLQIGDFQIGDIITEEVTRIDLVVPGSNCTFIYPKYHVRREQPVEAVLQEEPQL